MSKQRPTQRAESAGDGSPFAAPAADEFEAMLDAVGVDDVEDLFDIPSSVRFDGEFGIEPKSEQELLRDIEGTLSKNRELSEFLGRGNYQHYVPSLVDHLADRSEFLTSYTQYQPEITQGFLQALFEYQSLIVELTGLGIANCSMYDAATALGEAATLAARVRQTSGDRVLVPDLVRPEHREVLENYVTGTDLSVESYPTTDGVTDPETLERHVDSDVALIYAENPTPVGTVEEHLDAIGDISEECGALFCLGSDPVALSLFTAPADVGADIVVGDASVLGLPTSYGTGLGLFACREDFIRQVPGRLVGTSEDTDGTRAFTLTLQTREQHIRRERATSNICTNQAWFALRAAIHAASLGPTGLVELAEQCVQYPSELAAKLDRIDGVTAPVHDRHHFREFQVRVDRPAEEVATALESDGFAVHDPGDRTLQVCVTDANAHRIDAFVDAFEEVMS